MGGSKSDGEGRATGECKTKKTLQAPEVQKLVASLSNITERAGFEPAVQALPVRRFSKPLPSATRPPLQKRCHSYIYYQYLLQEN